MLTPTSQSKERETRYWAGAEILAATYLIAEVIYEVDGAPSTTAFITTDIWLAQQYLKEREDHPDLAAQRLLVRIGEYTYTTGEAKLEELVEILRCKQNGALVLGLESGEYRLDGDEPFTDSYGMQRFDVVYPKDSHQVEVRRQTAPPFAPSGTSS
jgi:hypothetical protein